MLNLIKNNIKFSNKWLIILIINYSCTNNLKVSESEILSASSWSKNDQLPTGDIEIEVSSLDVLNPAKTPPKMTPK